jgi:hypothetical protein
MDVRLLTGEGNGPHGRLNGPHGPHYSSFISLYYYMVLADVHNADHADHADHAVRLN